MEGKKINVYVMIGLPGAGKSTWAKENHPELNIIGMDDILIELGFIEPGEKGTNDTKKNKEAERIFLERIKKHVASGNSIVIDGVNCFKHSREKFKRLLSPFNVYWIYVWIETDDLQTNLKRRSGQLPSKMILFMKKNFEPPTKDEYNELIHIKQTNDGEIIDKKQGTYETGN